MFINEAYAQGAAQAQQGSSLFSLIFLTGIFILFYFLLIRPQRKRQADHEKMVKSLKAGDEVVMGGGFYGKIADVRNDHLVVVIASDTQVRVQRHAVNNVLPKNTLKSLEKS